MDPLTNDERIAALLDGRLGEQERAALLAELGLSRDELEILLDSAGITAELEEEDRASGVVPITMPPRTEGEPRMIVRPPLWRRQAVLSAAAVAVLAVGGGLLLTRGRTDAYATSAVQALANPSRGLPDSVQRPWAVSRGSGGRLGPAVSVRYGALAADLAIAANAGDRARFTAIADSIAELLAGGGNRVAVRDYAQLASGSTIPPPAALARLRDETAESMDGERVALGDWIEAARVAAFYRDARFFRSKVSRRFLYGEVKLETQAAEDELKAVRAAVPKEGGPDWGRLVPALSGLLEETG